MGGMERLQQTKRLLDDINTGDNVNLPKYRRSDRPKFEDRNRRITTYLENGLFHIVEELRDSGRITNLTQFYNEAIRAHLANNFCTEE